ncbi:hypothetical protein SCLCIDRAFT_169581 [Scleroderma citrinum Foug A]|uniref:Uncharacterized protein n=1 Tax=Scleroderma citrinum Foug A TaxID=1036808 RepID=A0A0C3ESJ7_9AGAM|nr:hypothetical protein SCLCIDRAFT_169581 [Scleroderma citrinum Foug A]
MLSSPLLVCHPQVLRRLSLCAVFSWTMSSPIPINAPSSRYGKELYIPVHRRAYLAGISPSSSSYAWSSSSRASSPTPSEVTTCSLSSVASSSRGITSSLPIYTPANLIRLSSSPLSKLSEERREVLRTTAPEVMVTRKQRKAQEWRARQVGSPNSNQRTHKRTTSRSSQTSDVDEQTWRRT